MSRTVTGGFGCALVAATLLAVPSQLFAQDTNDFSLQSLASIYVPDCRLRLDEAERPQAIVSGAGEVLDLALAARETPAPSNNVIGYWFSPAMTFLSQQKTKAATPQQAVGTLQLLHAIWRGPDFIKQNVYKARPIDVGWLIEVEHDFTNYPGDFPAIHPYELLLDEEHKVRQLRERCYFYRGSARVYTNTVTSVYEREIKLDGGLNYPEKLLEELRKAWAKEKEKMATEPGRRKKEERVK